MKRLVSLILGAALALSLAACSAGASDAGSDGARYTLTQGELILPESADAAPEEVAQAVQDSLSGGFQNVSAGVSDTGVAVTLSADGIGELAADADGGDETAAAEWQALADSVTDVCAAVRSALDAAGFSDMTIAFTVCNDLDTSYVLLTVQDGEVVFDVLEGFPDIDF